jgi:hypothetical protein
VFGKFFAELKGNDLFVSEKFTNIGKIIYNRNKYFILYYVMRVYILILPK